MPRRSNTRNFNGNPEPSAPPLHLMNTTTTSNSSRQIEYNNGDWGPPPRYEEALFDPTSAPHPSGVLRLNQNINDHHHPSNRVPLQTYQNIRNSSSPNDSNLSSSSQTSAQINDNHRQQIRNSNQSVTSLNSLSECRRQQTCEGRYRSASPGQLSEGSASSTINNPTRQQQRRSRRQEQANSVKPKSSKSKIKKGLENIAFFIIQILD